MKNTVQLMLVMLSVLALAACSTVTGGNVQLNPGSAHQEQIGAVANGP